MALWVCLPLQTIRLICGHKPLCTCSIFLFAKPLSPLLLQFYHQTTLWGWLGRLALPCFPDEEMETQKQVSGSEANPGSQGKMMIKAGWELGQLFQLIPSSLWARGPVCAVLPGIPLTAFLSSAYCIRDPMGKLGALCVYSFISSPLASYVAQW